MKRYIAFLGVIVLVFSVVLLSGCNEENKNNNNNNNNNNGEVNVFVGEWKIVTDTGDDSWTFDASNTGKRVVTYEGQQPYTEFFTWQDNNSQLCIKFGNNDRCGTYAFSNESNTFTWTVLRGEDIITTTFNRVT